MPRATFTRDGAYLAALAPDDSVHLWQMDVTAWRRELCALAGRNLTLQEWHEFLPGRLYRRTCG
jgi:hypothetical protein